jgi:CheY-like chemotaxis protein
MNSKSPLTFFVVENHQDTLDALRMFLEAQGHKVEAAVDVTTALAKAKGTKFDVLVSDIGLPDGDGWELMRRLRADMPEIKGIAMSGYGMKADLDRSKAAGFAAHIIKPFGPIELDSAVKKVLATESKEKTAKAEK